MPPRDEDANNNDDPNMVTDDDSGDDSFMQVASEVTKNGEGFDGFGTPDPYNKIDDGGVDAGQPNIPPRDEGAISHNYPNVVTVDDDSDDTFVQVASKVTEKGVGIAGCDTPDPSNCNTWQCVVSFSCHESRFP